MGMNFAFSWEIPFMQSLQAFAGDGAIKLCALLSMVGESYLMVAIIGVFYWGINKEMGKKIATSFAVANLFAPFVKNLINRRRPYLDHESVKCLRQAYPGDMYDVNVQGFSCPSLHASNTGAVLASIAMCLKKKAVNIILTCLILLIGAARVMLGVHYPTDVLLGWLIAAITVLVMPWVVDKVGNYLRVMLIFAVIGLPGWFLCTSEDFFVGYGAIIGIFLSFYIEEKFVHFENTPNVVRLILRTLVGIIVVLGVLEGLKLVLPTTWLETPGMLANILRAFRYAAATFAGLGAYPMLFKHTDRFFEKDRKNKVKERNQ